VDSNKATSSSASKLFASSSTSNRSKFELQRVDTETSDEAYWSCSKILEEPEEESVHNLTPRLQEDTEIEANLLEEVHNELLLLKGDTNKEMNITKTTLGTEEGSFSKDEIEPDSNHYDKENPLSLSIISSGDVYNEEKFTSPKPLGARKVPALNLAIIRKSLGAASLNSSVASTNDSRLEGKLPSSPNSNFVLKSLSKFLYKGSGLKQTRSKNQLSQRKQAKDVKLVKDPNTPTGKYYRKVLRSERKLSSGTIDSKKDPKFITTNKAFVGQHWDFQK
jgi:hypothetical protein